MITTDSEAAEAASFLERFERFVQAKGLEVTIIDAGERTMTVTEAAQAVNASPDEILKTLLFHDGAEGFVIAIAAGLARIDAKLLAGHQQLAKLKLAKPDVVLNTLGYPAGGVPPIGLPADIPVVVDTTAAQLDTCYAGAGTDRHLARFQFADILRLTNATVAQITTPAQ